MPDPTRVVLYGAHRIAQHWELPRYLSIRALLTTPSPPKTDLLIDWYAGLALDAVGEGSPDPQDRDAALILARRVAEASLIAWPIRQQAEGNRTIGPDTSAWLLLVMEMTLVYIRQRQADQVADLSYWVHDLAGELATL